MKPPVPQELLDELDSLVTILYRRVLKKWLHSHGYVPETLVCRTEPVRGSGGRYWNAKDPYRAYDATMLEVQLTVIRNQDAKDPIYQDEEDEDQGGTGQIPEPEEVKV